MYSQIQYGGIPRTFEIESLEDLSPLYMPSVDFDEHERSVRNDNTKKYFSFGYEFDLDINFFDYADITTLENGDLVYRMSIASENAFAISVQFNRFSISEGSDMFIYCLLYTSPSPRDATLSRMPSSA